MITSTPTVGVTFSSTSGNAFTFTPANPSKPPVYIAHGDPGGFTVGQYVPATLMNYTSSAPGSIWGPMMWSLHATGRPTFTQWTGSSWGTGTGQANLSALINATVGTTAKVDLVGQSMGGLGVLAWALANPTRVQSITLISPVVNILGQFDSSTGFAQEIATAWTGSSSGTRAAVATASGSVDPYLNTASLAPLANRMFIMNASNDTTVPPAFAHTFATAVGIPTSQQLWVTTGGHGAAISDPAYNDLTILRNIERCALI